MALALTGRAGTRRREPDSPRQAQQLAPSEPSVTSVSKLYDETAAPVTTLPGASAN